MVNSYQVVLELRYNQILNFTDKTLTGEISNYLGTLGYQVNLFNGVIDAKNPNTRHHFNIGSNRCGVDFSIKDLEVNTHKGIIEQLTVISNLLKFNFLSRIGLRVTTTNSYPILIDATKKITSILDIKNGMLENIKSNCEVCTLTFGIPKEGYSINLSLMPNQINVSAMGIDQQINTLNLDIDVFEMNLKCTASTLEKKYRTFLNDIKEYNRTLIEIL